MSNKKIDDIDKQLAGLEKIKRKSSDIVKAGKVAIKNNEIEDKDDSITAIKRVEAILEQSIIDAAQLATDSDLPKIYDSIAKLVKEFGTLQETKMNIHKSGGHVADTKNDKTNQAKEISSIGSIDDVIKQMEEEEDKDANDDE